MKYGYFDDLNKEYVITEPKTPYPWINYLGTEKFFSLVSNTAVGYCFYKDARLRRITRYRYNDIPVDNNGRYFYINDSGDIWSPTWKPVKSTLDFYECCHGLGYTRITGKRNNLKAEQLMFILRQLADVMHKTLVMQKTAGLQELHHGIFLLFHNPYLGLNLSMTVL